MPDALPPQTGPVAAFSRRLSLFCLWAAGTGLVAMTLIILWQVIGRYVFNQSPSWSEQFALYLMIWTVLFGAAAGVREQFHIRMTVLQEAAGAGRKIMLLLAHLVTGGIGLFLVIYGSTLVIRLWDFTIPTLGIPRGSALLPMPLAGAMITFFILEHIAALFRSREVNPSWP